MPEPRETPPPQRTKQTSKPMHCYLQELAACAKIPIDGRPAKFQKIPRAKLVALGEALVHSAREADREQNKSSSSTDMVSALVTAAAAANISGRATSSMLGRSLRKHFRRHAGVVKKRGRPIGQVVQDAAIIKALSAPELSDLSCRYTASGKTISTYRSSLSKLHKLHPSLNTICGYSTLAKRARRCRLGFSRAKIAQTCVRHATCGDTMFLEAFGKRWRSLAIA